MNSISSIVNRPAAAIQFGSDRRPAPRIIDEVRTEESDTFADVENTPLQMQRRRAQWFDDINLQPLLPTLPQLQNNGAPPAIFLARREPLTNVQDRALRRQQETQRARLLPTQEELSTVGGNVLGGTPDSYNGLENENISPPMPPAAEARTLPFLSFNSRTQETQQFRLMPRPPAHDQNRNLAIPAAPHQNRNLARPVALHPIRNFAELLSALDVPHQQPGESQNSRPGTPDSQPNPNQQNQPE